MEENGELIPTRSKWKDIGPGESHKKKIVELYLKGYEYTEIEQRIKYSGEAIMRYVKNFARILVLSEEGYSDNEIRMMADVSIKTVQGYKELIKEYDSEEYQKRFDQIRRIFQKKEDVQTRRLQELEISDKGKRLKR